MCRPKGYGFFSCFGLKTGIDFYLSGEPPPPPGGGGGLVAPVRGRRNISSVSKIIMGSAAILLQTDKNVRGPYAFIGLKQYHPGQIA